MRGNLFRHLQNFYQLSRPLNVFIAFSTIWIAAMLVPDARLNTMVLLAATIAALITAASNIINDIFDLEIDRINKPGRVLPSGRATVREARIYFTICLTLAFLLALFTPLPMLLIAVGIAGFMVVYSKRLKRTVLWGNLAVSFASAMAFIYGALAVGDISAGLIPASFAFLFHLGREILKDMEDVEGDIKNMSITFPARHGFRASVILIDLIFIFLIILTLLPYILNVYNKTYLWVVIIGVHTVLLFCSVSLWFRRDKVWLGRMSHLLKLDMLVGLAAIYLGI